MYLRKKCKAKLFVKDTRRQYIITCRFKEGRYPENLEKLMIQNTSPLEAEISFCFMNDSKGETYLLDPPNMTLKPGEQQVLNTLYSNYA